MLKVLFYVIIIGVLAQSVKAIPLDETENAINPFLSSRIVGGSDASLDDARHMVGLVFGDRIVLLVCGGSIISTRHVLTAAHCVEAFLTWEGKLWPSLHGVVGSLEYDSLLNIIKFSRHVIHPQYDRWIIKNDIGILTTEETIRLSKNIGVISLGFNWVGGNEECLATGWGLTNLFPQTNHLQKLKVRTLSPELCQEGLEQASADWIYPPPMDPKIELCTLHSVGKGMCNGDSGSALATIKDGKQVGIVSWGFPCAVGLPDIFVRVSAYKVFILNVLREEHSL